VHDKGPDRISMPSISSLPSVCRMRPTTIMLLVASYRGCMPQNRPCSLACRPAVRSSQGGDGAGPSRRIRNCESLCRRSSVRQTSLPERMDSLVKNSTIVGERTRAILLVRYPSISQTPATVSRGWLYADYATTRPCLCLTPSARAPRQIVRDEPIP